MKTIFKLKTWQLFIIIVCPLLLIDAYENVVFQSLFSIFEIVVYLGTYLFFYEVLKPKYAVKGIKPIIFQICVIMTMVFLGILQIIDLAYLSDYILNAFYIIITLSVFYIIYFMSNLFMQVERKTNILYYMVLFWVLPIGVWVIFPKIKKINPDF